MKIFGGPGEIRTHDLFHAMEAGIRSLQPSVLIPLRKTKSEVVGSGTDLVVARALRQWFARLNSPTPEAR